MEPEALQSENDKDHFRLWRHAHRVMNPNYSFDQGVVFAQHRRLQSAYLKAMRPKVYCSGLLLKTKSEDDTKPHMCRQIGCPSCWYRRRCELFGVASQLKSEFFYVKVIESDIGHPIDPAMIRSFKEDWTGMKMVGHMVGCDTEDNWGLGWPAWVMVYRMVGLFVSDKKIRPKRSQPYEDPYRFRIEFRNNSALYTAFHTDYYEHSTAADAIEEWLRFDPYPYRISGLWQDTGEPWDNYPEFLATVNRRSKWTGHVRSGAHKRVRAT